MSDKIASRDTPGATVGSLALLEQSRVALQILLDARVIDLAAANRKSRLLTLGGTHLLQAQNGCDIGGLEVLVDRPLADARLVHALAGVKIILFGHDLLHLLEMKTLVAVELGDTLAVNFPVVALSPVLLAAAAANGRGADDRSARNRVGAAAV